MARRAQHRGGRALLLALAAILVAFAVQQVGVRSAAASPGGTITVDHATTTVPTKLIVSGWCAEPRPATTPLALDGTQLMTVAVDPVLGTWGSERVLLGADVAIGSHVLTTGCGGSATVTVTGAVRPPTLVIGPTTAHLPATLTLTGTCPVGTRTVELFVDQQDRGPLPIDPVTGVLPASTLHLGAATAVGSHIISTSCGASASFLALAAPPAPTSGSTPASPSPSRSSAPATTTTAAPAVQLVRVPDLVGLTVAQAKAVLGDSLRLDGAGGATARIHTQHPAAGTLVVAGTTVTVTLENAAPWWNSSRTAWLVAGGVAVLLLALAVAWSVGYVRRGRRRPPPSTRPPSPVPTVTGQR